jgi:hypothetical protein
MKKHLVRVAYTLLMIATVTMLAASCSASAVWGS